MTKISKVAAGVIAGAAIASAPLVALAAPAFAATDAVKPAASASHEQHVLVNSASAGITAQHTRAARCGGGINC